MKAMRLTSWAVLTLIVSSCLMFPAGALQAQVTRTSDASAAMKPVSINKADLDELQTVRGIGPSLAERIVQFRGDNGGFKTLEQLKEVKGIGDVKFEKIKSQLSL